MENAASNQSDAAYARIRSAVLGGEFAIGDVVTETQLAARCRVSRTPVREAVQRLVMEHVLLRAERGLIIPDPSPEEIYDIYEAAAVLDAAIPRFAAERRTEVDLAHIDRWIDAERAVIGDDSAERSIVNFEFNKAVWRAGHNQTLFEMLEQIGVPNARFGGRTTMSVPGQAQRTMERHRAMRDAVAERDSARAATIALATMQEIRDMRIQMWHARNRTAPIIP